MAPMSGVLCVWVYDLHMFVLCSGISVQHNANHPCVHVIYTFLCLYVVVEVEQFVRCTRYDSYMCLLDVRSGAYKCWVQGRHRNVTRRLLKKGHRRGWNMLKPPLLPDAMAAVCTQAFAAMLKNASSRWLTTSTLWVACLRL